MNLFSIDYVGGHQMIYLAAFNSLPAYVYIFGGRGAMFTLFGFDFEN